MRVTVLTLPLSDEEALDRGGGAAGSDLLRRPSMVTEELATTVGQWSSSLLMSSPGEWSHRSIEILPGRKDSQPERERKHFAMSAVISLLLQVTKTWVAMILNIGRFKLG